MALTLTLLLLTLTATGAETSSVGGWWLVFASQGDGQAQPGSVILLISSTGDTLFDAGSEKGLFELSAGGASTVGTALVDSQENCTFVVTRTLFDSANRQLSLMTKTTYTSSGPELSVSVQVTVVAASQINNGLWLEIPCTSQGEVVFRNTAGQFTRTPAVTASKPQKLPYQSSISLPSPNSRMRVILRNPLIPVPVRTVNSIRLELLCADPPCTTLPEGLGTICSILQPGDTIRASFSVIPERIADPAPVTLAFSPHPDGAEQTAYLAFDDIPTPELSWATPTGPDNVHTPFISNFLKLLSMFPDVKFTWLLLTDNIQQKSEWNFKGWWAPRAGVSPDSSESNTGRFSARLHQPLDPVQTAIISYGFPVEPDSTYTISGMYKTDVLTPPCNFSLYVGAWPVGTELNTTAFSLTSTGWQPFELSFRANHLGAAYCLLRFNGAEGNLYLDDVNCIEDFSGKELFLNGGFEEFSTFPAFKGTDTSWYSGSGAFLLARDYSPEVLHWLQQLQDGSPDWPFSRQIGLGLHGLHHTPNRRFPEGGDFTHEFNFFDPVGDSVRIARIVNDVRAIGLDPVHSLSFFRFPGHRHTESVLNPIFQSDIRVIDAGINVTNYHFGRIVRENKMIWQTSSVSWHDSYYQEHWDHLTQTLDMGMFALMGAHFHVFAYFANAGAWDRAVNQFEWMESSYPHLLWLKGDQLSRFWDELDQIRSIKQTSFGKHLSLQWDGATILGETIYFELPNGRQEIQSVAVDNTPIGYDVHGSRIFIPLPSLAVGHHSLDIIRGSMGDPEQSDLRWSVSTEGPEGISLSRMSAVSSELSYTLFDAQGRRVSSSMNLALKPGRQIIDVRFSSVPSGFYFVVIKENGTSSTIRLSKTR